MSSHEPIPLHGPAPRPYKGLRPAEQLEALAVQLAGKHGNRVGNVRNLATEADLAALDEWMVAIDATSCGLGGGTLWWQVHTPSRVYNATARDGAVFLMGEQVWPSPRTKPDATSHLPAGQFRGRLR